MDDSDSDYEETEFLVYADFNNQLMRHELKQPNAAIKFIGLESQEPVAEINGSIFKGTYELAMGTNVFFEKDSTNVPGDPLFESACKQKFKYFDKTVKVINFRQIYVEKQADLETENFEPEENVASCIKTESNQVKLNINYKGALKSFCNGD